MSEFLKTFFESPTIASSSKTLSANVKPTEDLDVLPIVPVPRDGNLPPSFAQQRLWFLDQLEPGSAVYNICRAYRLMRQLDATTMEESLNAVVQRHEILRTTFPALDGQPKQVIAPVLRLPLSVVDLRELPVVEREAQSVHMTNEEARRPFNLAEGPLVRVTLVGLAEDEYLFLLTVHQIVCDGWSIQIFLHEFWTCYEAYWQNIRPLFQRLSSSMRIFRRGSARYYKVRYCTPSYTTGKSNLEQICLFSTSPLIAAGRCHRAFVGQGYP